MGLQDLVPGLVERLGHAEFTRIGDDALDQAFDLRLALVMGPFPFLVRGTKRMPVRALCLGGVLDIGPLAVRERDDPVLQKVTLRIRLNVNGHVLVMRGAFSARLKVPVFAAVGIGEYGGARSA